MKTRRDFIKRISSGMALVLGGGLRPLSAQDVFELGNQVKLRFIIASDSHYGQPKTQYDEMVKTFIAKANLFQESSPVDFCVINGDIIHDQPKFMPEAKTVYDTLKVPYYVTKGNHDRVSDDEWQRIWGMPVNHHDSIKKNEILLVTTSNEKGDYLSPDLNYLKEELDAISAKRNVFLFVHIPQTKWTANAIETTEFFELLKNYPNVRAIFHGHEHDQDGIKTKDGKPYIFDSHIGGSWGTDYRGFRVVELMKDNSLVTYMMNPTEAMEKVSL